MISVVLDIETIPDAAAAARASIDLSQGFPAWPIHELACVSLLSVEHHLRSDYRFQIQTFSRADMAERGIIAAVERSIENAFELVTWNGRGFDVPVMMARAALARERCPTIARLMAQSRRTSGIHVDVLDEVTGYGAAPRVKLADFCAAFSIPVKVEAHGSDVATLVERGDWGTVSRYCETDVVATWLALQAWRSAERDDPETLDRAWTDLSQWIGSAQPELAHLLPYSVSHADAWGGRALSPAHVADIRF